MVVRCTEARSWRVVGAVEVGWCRVACIRPESEPVGPTLVSVLGGEAAAARASRPGDVFPANDQPHPSGGVWTACADTSEGGATVVDLDCGDKVWVGRAVVRVMEPGTRSGEAQNPDRPARREPHTLLRTTRARIEPRRPRFTAPSGQDSLNNPRPGRPAGASAWAARASRRDAVW